VNTAQYSIEVCVEGRDDIEIEMLSSADFRSFASTCFAAYYPNVHALPGEELLATISPGEERYTSLSDTKCLLTFLVEIETSRGERVGHCEFRRDVLMDLIEGMTRRNVRRRSANGALNGSIRDGILHQRISYCLHYHAEGAPLRPRFKSPPIQHLSFALLRASATPCPLTTPRTNATPAVMTTFITPEVFTSLTLLSQQSEASSLEEGCFLDGDILFDPDTKQFGRFFRECIPALQAERDESQVRFNGECWAHYYKTRSGKGVLLAEGHSHPSTLVKPHGTGTAVFMSPADRSIHRNFFWQFFQGTTIVSTPNDGEMQMGIWGHADGLIVPEQEAFILSGDVSTT
jgi:hypothetical protein